MLCQKCNKKVATVFISTIVNGQNSQMYLCKDCAREFHDNMNLDMQIPFPINDILSNMSFDESTVNDLINSLKEMETSGELNEMINQEHTETGQQVENNTDEVSEKEK
ncbi:MAG: hypothetical protein ACI4PU_03550, partial [Intestinibacter sp.]